MPRVAVLNHGNRRSVIKALEHIGAETCPTIRDATHVIIPGVGTMRTAMDAINKVRDDLEWFREQGRPILGICAGFHAMCRHSEEGDCDGLGWLGLDVERLKEPPIPRQGWEMIAGVGTFYFSHGYAVMADGIVNRLLIENIVGVQFHPEKSQGDGLRFLKEFVEWTC